jgi:hydrogenase maturation protease
MQKVLIIGYGNADREDDGVAWHILQALSTYYHSPIIESDGGIFEAEHNPHLIFSLQLTPEMSEALTQYEQVCFIDAHTGAYAEEVRAEIITPNFQASPFTHHLTPESCLSLAQNLYGSAPQAMMVSARGYQFGYFTELSPQTARLVPIAAAKIIEWLS